MTSCDTNILFAALDSESALHVAARKFLNDHSGDDRFCVCELILVELYVLLRNPAVCKTPHSAEDASRIVQRFRTHPRWSILDYPGPQAGIMNRFWKTAAAPQFAFRKVYDLRLALALRHHGVRNFATRNTRDFQDVGFDRVWDPLVDV